MIQRTCSFCQNHGTILTDIGFLCESCFNVRYTKCDCCNNYHHSAYIRHFNGESLDYAVDKLTKEQNVLVAKKI